MIHFEISHRKGHSKNDSLRNRSRPKMRHFEINHFEKVILQKSATSKNGPLRNQSLPKMRHFEINHFEKSTLHKRATSKNESKSIPSTKREFENVSVRKNHFEGWLRNSLLRKMISSFEFVLSHQLKLVIRNVAMQIEIILNYFNFQISLFRDRKFAGFRWSSSTSSMSEDNHIFPLHLKHVSSLNFNTKTTGLFLILHFRNDNDLFTWLVWNFLIFVNLKFLPIFYQI